MLEHLKAYKIILGSNSPRRKELLAGLDVSFEVKTIENIEEDYPSNLQGSEVALFLAKKKASYYHPISPDELLITADTIVILEDDIILGKPQSKQEAINMLEVLSAKKHRVSTGVCIRTSQTTKSFVVTSEVEFDQLESDEILYYVEKYLPLDKAGAYGIQEWIGYVGVKKISGSYFNIMGLPVQRLYKELKNIK